MRIQKYLTLLIMLVLMASVTQATMTYTTLDKPAAYGKKTQAVPFIWNWAQELETALGSGLYVQLTPTTEPTGATGMLYYDSATNTVKVYTGAAFVALATASGNSLDASYDAGSAITVDGDAITLTTGAAVNNSALAVVHGETTNNNDAMTISVAGTGDALQISPGAVSGGGINIISAASGTTALVTLDGSTNNWDGADNVGQLLIQTDDPFIHAGASALVIKDSSTPITAAEGFMARFVHSGVAQTNATAVEIEVPATQPALAVNGITKINGQDAAGAAIFQVAGVGVTGNADAMTISNTGTGDCLQISPGGATTNGLNMIGYAASTVPLVVLDASTNNMNLADNKGQLLVQNDTAYAHAGASGIVVTDSSTPITAAEGFLARFVHSGTARTNSSAVEIEVPATQPALATNGIVAINGQDAAGGAILQVAGVGTTGNADAMTITNLGTGDCLQVSPTDATTGGINLVGVASGTVSGIVANATAGWLGADDVGFVHINSDSALTHNGATLLFVGNATGQPKDGAEGYLARFVDTGTARTGACAVEIETTNTTPALKLNNQLQITGTDSTGVLVAITGNDDTGDTDIMQIANGAASDAIQITNSDVLGTGLRVISVADQTTASVVIDGSTGNWDGADNVGMLTLTTDTAGIHTGATLLMVQNTGTMIAAAEGYLARFVQDTGAAVTDAYAVEIETTDTSPALMLNNQMTIAGGATAGVLMDITSVDADDDTVQLTGAGTGDVLQITANATTSTALNAIAKAAGTVSLAKFDAATNNWNGADNIGLVQISSDTALAHAGSSLLFVGNTTGQPIAAAEGYLARFVDTGTARADAYAVEIEVTDTTGGLKVDGHSTFTKGLQTGSQTVTATADGLTTGLIPDGASFVTVSSDNADKVVVLPAAVIGNVIRITSPTTGVELETLAGSNAKINNVDCDGTNQCALTANSIYEVVCTAADYWVIYGWSSAGAAQATIVPDAD